MGVNFSMGLEEGGGGRGGGGRSRAMESDLNAHLI